MRKIRSFISFRGFIFLSIITLPSVCLAQSRQEESHIKIDVPSLLAQTDYKYSEVREGMWKIPELPHRGKNIKILDVFLSPNPNNNSLRVSLRLGFHYTSMEAEKFNEKLDDLSKRFKPAEFVLSGATLFVVTELPADKLDKNMLVQAIEKAAGEADQAHSELTKFVKLGAEESTGPGMGGGIGTGSGVPVKEPKLPIPDTHDNPESNIARSVDSRPVLLNRVHPSYTEEARRNRVEGVVRLRILVDETGKAKQVRVSHGLPDGLNEEAVEAAYKMQFKPAMKDGKAVAFYITIEITFNLR
jgi:protein TonB